MAIRIDIPAEGYTVAALEQTGIDIAGGSSGSRKSNTPKAKDGSSAKTDETKPSDE